jgi:hypothetical protein
MNPPQKQFSLNRGASRRQFQISFYWVASLLLFLTVTTAVQAQYTYTINNGQITITGYTGPGGAVTIPSTINGWPVTSIGVFAFQDKTSLTSVIIPDSVTSIGNWAFQACTSLTSVIIPDSVTSIRAFAFDSCTSLTSVSIGNSVTTIGDWAFAECTSLTSVIIPDSVTSIGYWAFAECTSLTSITVDAANPSYSSDGAGVLFNRTQTTLIQCPRGKTGTYIIPNTVTSIGDEAFSYCTSLTSVIIPDSVTSIGDQAFSYCTSLTSVIIPDSVTSIGNWAFAECTSLTSVSIGNSVTSIGHYSFEWCTSLTSVYFRGNAFYVSSDVFANGSNPTVYYLPGTTGWGPTFSGRPTVLWNPQAVTRDGSFGITSNQFGFNITGTSDLVVVVEASPSLTNPIWTPVSTNTLTDGSSLFSDPQWMNHPGRFYRLRSP